jgi:hypothetical protein
LIFALAQTAQGTTVVVQEAEWKFWLMIIVGALTLFSTILTPFILLGIAGIKERLDRGDRKFDEQAKQITRLETRDEVTNKSIEIHATEIKAAAKEMQEVYVVGTGQIGQLARDIERDFVRKEHFQKEVNRLEDKVDSLHGKTLQEIREIRQGGRR